MERIAHRKGRPPIPNEKKRRRVNLTLSPEVLNMAAKAIETREESSLSELVEAALRKVIVEDRLSEGDRADAPSPPPVALDRLVDEVDHDQHDK